MNNNELLKAGDTYTGEYTVKTEDTADFIGNKGIMMLSTPAMIKFMEVTAAQIALKNMPDNYRVVGTKVEIKHINPTPVDSKVTVKATLTAVEGNKLRYEVEAFNKTCKLGFGVYEQNIINIENFLNKCSK
jgi:predicted thioesterase